MFCLIIPGIMIAIGLIWPSFYWLCIGIFTAVAIIINTIACLVKKECYYEFAGENGSGVLMIVVIFFSLAYWMYNDTRFISSNGGKQHIYSDCSTFKSGSKIKEVSELQGFLYGCFSDCKICVQRETEEDKMKEREEEKRREIIAHRERQQMINKLQDAIDELQNGESAESVASSLVDNFLDEGYIEIETEDNEFIIHGLPSRYQ